MPRLIFVLFSLMTSLTSTVYAQKPTIQDKCDCDEALVRRWNEKYRKDFHYHSECVDDDCSNPVELVKCPDKAMADARFAQAFAVVDAYYKSIGEDIQDEQHKDAIIDIRERVNRLQKINEREVILARTIWDLEHLTFDASDGPPPNFYEIARANLPSMYYRAEQDQLNGICSGSSIAASAPNMATEPKRCTLCDDFYSIRTNPLVRVITLVHEARHRIEYEPNHVQCRAGPYYSKESLNLLCDWKLEDEPGKNGSGYNAGVYFMWWLINKQTSNNDEQINHDFRKPLVQVYLKEAIQNRFYEEVTDEQYRKYNVPKPIPVQGHYLSREDAQKVAQSIEMVSVQGGSFEMGSADEKPIHKVTVSGFKLGKYEITQLQWSAVIGNNPSVFKGCDNCPVENVSWDDIQQFLQKLNRMTGKNYRLPTEAEWEYAARGGSQSRGYIYSGSNNEKDVAWFD